MIKNIATVGVYVDDQQKAKQFWTEKVGFDGCGIPNGA